MNLISVLKTVLKFFLIIVVSMIIGKLAVAFLGYTLFMYYATIKNIVLETGVLEQNPIIYNFSLLLEQIVMILVILFGIYKIDKIGLSGIGLKFSKKSILNTVMGMIFGFISVATVVGIYLLIDNYGVNVVREFTNNQPLSRELFLEISFWCILLIFVAIQEELLLRGYMLKNLENTKKWLAVFIVSLTFSLLHIQNPQFSFENSNKTMITIIALMNIFFISCIWASYVVKTKDLYLPIGAHFAWNFSLGNIFGFNISGIETPSIFTTSTSINIKYMILTGGKIGPEGGIVVTCAIIIMALLIWEYSKLAYKKAD